MRWRTRSPEPVSSHDLPRPATEPLWKGTVVLRIVTYCFAIGAVIANYDGYRNTRLAVAMLVAIGAWSVVTVVAYWRPRWRKPAVVVADLLVTCGLMYTSRWILSPTQLHAAKPLITTVWASEPGLAAGVIGGRTAGGLAGLLVAVVTGLTRFEFNTDVTRDAVLLVGSGFIIGMAATTARRSTAQLERALRTEAATAERERLARSIHDSVLQVLARVRRRGNEVGGEAGELARMAGEQEVALRALVASAPNESDADGRADLRAGLQVLATPKVAVATPATPVWLPAGTASELVSAVVEALSNVDKHAGPGARAWVLLEDLGSSVIITVRDNGVGIAAGRLEEAERQGRLGVAKSMRARLCALGGILVLDSGNGRGTEWEIRIDRESVPRGRQSSAWLERLVRLGRTRG